TGRTAAPGSTVQAAAPKHGQPARGAIVPTGRRPRNMPPPLKEWLHPWPGSGRCRRERPYSREHAVQAIRPVSRYTPRRWGEASVIASLGGFFVGKRLGQRDGNILGAHIAGPAIAGSLPLLADDLHFVLGPQQADVAHVA